MNVTTTSTAQEYGWTVPVGIQQSHYVVGARLKGRSGWLGRTACGQEGGGNVPLQPRPYGRVCESCARRAGL